MITLLQITLERCDERSAAPEKPPPAENQKLHSRALLSRGWRRPCAPFRQHVGRLHPHPSPSARLGPLRPGRARVHKDTGAIFDARKNQIYLVL